MKLAITSTEELLAAERAVMAAAAVRQAELAMIDVSGFTRQQMADHTIAMVTATERAAVVAARFVAIAQDSACALTKGESSMTSALNNRCRISRRRGSQMDLAGSAKERYPHFYAALLDGHIGMGHIEAVQPIWKAVDSVQFAMAEEQLANLAVLCTPEEFVQYLNEWRHHADEDAALDEYIANQARQHFSYGFDLFGNAHYSGTVGPEHAEPFIETIEHEAANHSCETPSQALGASIVELVLNPDGKYRAHLEVLVPEHHKNDDGSGATAECSEPDPIRANHIRDPFDRGFSTVYTPRTARGTCIPPAVVAAMKASGARVREHAVDSDGNIASDRRGGRHFGAAQKRLIRLRDNRCQHSGCRRPARRSQYDHIEPYEFDGPTLISNGQSLCLLHHRWKHYVADQGGTSDSHRAAIFDDSPLVVQLE